MATADVSLTYMLGDYLLDNQLQQVPINNLLNESPLAIGLFFAGKWCSSTQAFLPKLVNWYHQIRERHKQFLIIYISCDMNQAEFDEMVKSMPWHALPYDQREKKQYLSRKYRIPQIPRLIYINKDGSLINKDGRIAVFVDPKGSFYPYKDSSIKQLMNLSTVLSKNGVLEDNSVLENKIIGLYFAALWCLACPKVTEPLAKLYEALKSKGVNFEIIFASCDNSLASFLENYKSMPWLALEFKKDVTLPFARFCGIQTIPTLILINEAGHLITSEGHLKILEDPEGKDFPWKTDRIAPFSGTDLLKLNESPAFILLCDKDMNCAESTRSQLEPIANEDKYEYGCEAREHQMLFYYSSPESNVELEGLIKVPQELPALVIIDVPFNASYVEVVKKSEGLSTTLIKRFIADFREGQLTPQPILV